MKLGWPLVTFQETTIMEQTGQKIDIVRPLAVTDIEKAKANMKQGRAAGPIG